MSCLEIKEREKRDKMSSSKKEGNWTSNAFCSHLGYSGYNLLQRSRVPCSRYGSFHHTQVKGNPTNVWRWETMALDNASTHDFIDASSTTLNSAIRQVRRTCDCLLGKTKQNKTLWLLMAYILYIIIESVLSHKICSEKKCEPLINMTAMGSMRPHACWPKSKESRTLPSGAWCPKFRALSKSKCQFMWNRIRMWQLSHPQFTFLKSLSMSMPSTSLIQQGGSAMTRVEALGSHAKPWPENSVKLSKRRSQDFHGLSPSLKKGPKGPLGWKFHVVDVSWDPPLKIPYLVLLFSKFL